MHFVNDKVDVKLRAFVYRSWNFLLYISFLSDVKAGTSKESVSNMKDGKAKELPSFWIPAMTPDSKPTLLKKPVSQERDVLSFINNCSVTSTYFDTASK